MSLSIWTVDTRPTAATWFEANRAPITFLSICEPRCTYRALRCATGRVLDGEQQSSSCSHNAKPHCLLAIDDHLGSKAGTTLSFPLVRRQRPFLIRQQAVLMRRRCCAAACRTLREYYYPKIILLETRGQQRRTIRDERTG